MAKNKIAIFDLTGCEGCEFHVLSREDIARELFRDFEITNWRLLTEHEQEECDIAIVEGAVTTPGQAELLGKVRENARIVIALGACACTGNVFAQLTPDRRAECASRIYGAGYALRAKFLEPPDKFIRVDEKVPGCPPDVDRLKRLLDALKGERPVVSPKAVRLPDFVAKIEGHGRLTINYRHRDAEFEVVESERLIEGLLLGKPFPQAPYITARVCGICCVAHNLCAWMAIESAMGIVPAPATVSARKVLLAAQAVKSHLMHLFFLVLPDYAGERRSAPLFRRYPNEFILMLKSHRACERVLRAVAGSTAFPVATGLGGFLSVPDAAELRALRSEIRADLDRVHDLVGLFASLETPIMRSGVTLFAPPPPGNEYPLYGDGAPPAIRETVRAGSTAKLGILHDGKTIKVGALARVAKYGNRLNAHAKAARAKHPFDTADPFRNNLAQAIEILHYLEEIARLIEELPDEAFAETGAVKSPDFSRLPASGEACVEAPRGTLIHRVGLGASGEITAYTIISPTQLNLAALEIEAKQLVRERGDLNEVELKREAEKLLRAFDPCITCAVH
jgi:coenzyme F420-reducing hydrogenase alpha subunit/Ni,Fe-hydrogenase III small subunit